MTLLVNYDLSELDDGLTRFSAELSERLDATAIGVAASAPLNVAYVDGYVSGDVIEQDRLQIEGEIKRREASFRAAFGARARDWRASTSYRPTADYVAMQARAADIILANAVRDALPFDGERRIDLGDLVMRAGRPVLVVPPDAGPLALDCVLIGWKDARETRRAVADALPLLGLAKRVIVAEIAAGDTLERARERVRDVGGWLAAHGITAEPRAIEARGDDAGQLEQVAADFKAGLLVAGAYGHNRLREWVLGGVTRDVLLKPSRPALLSH
jgi:nucleotide-binding universal stress UspA family protein